MNEAAVNTVMSRLDADEAVSDAYKRGYRTTVEDGLR